MYKVINMWEREKTQISLALIMISQENQPSYDTQMSIGICKIKSRKTANFLIYLKIGSRFYCSRTKNILQLQNINPLGKQPILIYHAAPN